LHARQLAAAPDLRRDARRVAARRARRLPVPARHRRLREDAPARRGARRRRDAARVGRDVRRLPRRRRAARVPVPAGPTNAEIHTWLQSIDASIVTSYCFRFKAAGTAGSNLTRALIHVSARYRAPAYSPNPQTTGITPHVTVNVVASGAPGWTGPTTFRTNLNGPGAF